MTERLQRNDLNRKMLGIALPMALEGLASAGGDLADSLMVASLGERAVSAVGLGTQLFFVHLMLVYGFTGGASTFMAQFYGVRDMRGIKKTLAMAVSVSVLVGSVLLLIMHCMPQRVMGLFTNITPVQKLGASYILYRSPALLISGIVLPVIMALKAMQQVRTAVTISLSAVALNVWLNYVLIFGHLGFPAMGVRGAALATLLATLAELILLFAVLRVRRSELTSRFGDYLHWTKPHFLEVIRNSVPTTINEMMWSMGTSSYNAAYGRISTSAMAAASAADIVAHVFTKTIYACGDAALVIVGELLGQNQKEEAWDASGRLLRICILMGIIGGGLLAALAIPVSALFGFTEEGTRSLRLILFIYAAAMPLKVYNASIITGVLRSGGDVRFAMVTEVSTIWLIGVPVVFLCALAFRLPVYLVVLAVQMEDVVKGIIITRRYRSRKWMNNKVEEIKC